MTDSQAVETLATAMKKKLAKQQTLGERGWQGCDPEYLRDQLFLHIRKGDPVDVANFCAFLFARDESTK